jgi:tetraacyldisaccharide 4'-kinase
LRETLKSLNRSDVIVMSGELDASVVPISGKPIWRMHRDLEISGAPARPIVFCGIARPKRFLEQLRAKGISPVAEKFYRDHHAYSDQNIEELLRLKTRSNGDGFITTEKDVANLGARASRLAPLAIAKVTMDILDSADAVDTVLRVIHSRKP